jgi:hypothetical protein
LVSLLLLVEVAPDRFQTFPANSSEANLLLTI